MPPIKCKFFDENGNILSKRHLDTKCPFVHPDNPDWKRARPLKPRRTESYPETWAPDVPTLTSSNTTGLAATGRIWGKSAEDHSRRQSDAQPETGPYSSKNATTSGSSRAENNPSSSSSALAPKESSHSWADALAKAAEKDAVSNPWGSSSGNEAWGSGGGSWGGANDTGTSAEKAKTTDSGGRGTQSGSANLDRPSTSGSLGDKGKGRAVDRQKDKEDIAMRDPSPPSRPPPSTAAAPIPPPIRDDRTKKPKRVDLPLLNPAVRSARERTPSFSPAPLTAIATKPLPRPVMPSLSKATSAESALNASQGDEDGRGKMSRSGTPTSNTVTKSYKGYEGRAALFSEVVSHLQEAVVFEIVYLRAQAEAMRWKKTQSSEIYAHTTRKARTIMDDRRAHFQSKISGAKFARDRALQRLGSLPELPTRTDQLAAIKVEKETIRAYTEELKEWLEELERHRSLLKAKQEAEEAQANSSHSPETVSGIPTQPQLQTLQSFFQREKWTWKDLKEAPSLIDSAIEDAQAIIYREDYTRINELYFDDLEVLDEQIPPIAADEGTPDIENQRFVPRIEANGKNIDELVNRTTGLVHKIDSLKEEIEEVKKQREKMDKIYAQAEKQFSECDSNKETEAAKIRELTEQLQSLSLHKRPAAKTSTTLSPVKIDDLLEYIRPIVVERVTADLTKIVQSLAMRCRENQDRMADEIDEMLKPVLASTEQIRQNSLSLSATSPSQPATVSDTIVS